MTTPVLLSQLLNPKVKSSLSSYTGLVSDVSETTCSNEIISKFTVAKLASAIGDRLLILTKVKQSTTDAKLDRYLGLTLESAEKLASQENPKHRPGRVGGKDLRGSVDCIPDRLNFTARKNSKRCENR